MVFSIAVAYDRGRTKPESRLKRSYDTWEASDCTGPRGPIRCCAAYAAALRSILTSTPPLIRVLWVIAFFCGTFGFWAYLICALIMPKKSDIYPEY